MLLLLLLLLLLQCWCSTTSSISKVETVYDPTKIHPSRKLVYQWADGKKTKAVKLENFTTDKNQDIYSYDDRLLDKLTQQVQGLLIES